MRCDPGFSLDTFYINKYNFCYPFLPISGVLSGVKANPKIASIGHSALGNPKVRYDTGFCIAFYLNTCPFCYLFLLPLLELRSGAKPSLRYLYWSFRSWRSLRYAMAAILTLFFYINKYQFWYHLFTHFGFAVRGKAILEMLAFVIPCSENTIR